MRKALGVFILSLSLFVAGCAESVDENVLTAGKEFYAGETKEDLEEDIEKNLPSKLIVVDDTYFTDSFMYEQEGITHETVSENYYIQKGNYKNHPQYEVIDIGGFGFEDKEFTVVAVNYEDYFYLISTNLIEDVGASVDDENSLISAKSYYDMKTSDIDAYLSSGYFYKVLREMDVEAEEE